jgi:hypothetical protein
MAFELTIFKALPHNLAVVDAGFNQLAQGGLSEVYLILNNNITGFPSYNPQYDVTGKFQLSSTNITLAANSKAYRIRFSPETGGFQETMKEDARGTWFEKILKFDLPKDRPEVAWLKWRMRDRRYLVIYRDNNGLVKVIGDASKGMQFNFSLDTKTAHGDFNGHTMTGRLSTLKPAPFWNITGAIIDSITIS